jgi:hypothetical protein
VGGGPGTRAALRFRFRYVLHPWTAKYSHWMWHWAIAFCQRVCDSSAKCTARTTLSSKPLNRQLSRDTLLVSHSCTYIGCADIRGRSSHESTADCQQQCRRRGLVQPEPVGDRKGTPWMPNCTSCMLPSWHIVTEFHHDVCLLPMHAQPCHGALRIKYELVLSRKHGALLRSWPGYTTASTVLVQRWSKIPTAC